MLLNQNKKTNLYCILKCDELIQNIQLNIIKDYDMRIEICNQYSKIVQRKKYR